nr:apolipoprotein N-acyltransferase [Oceanipulchritudo coccoides]
MSAGLYVLAFPSGNVPETAYVFAVPLLLLGLFTRPAKREGWMILFSGWIGWAILLIWLKNVTSHLEMALAPVLGWLAVIGLSGIMAIFWWVWFAGSLRLVRSSVEKSLLARLGAVLALAGFWVFLEWVRCVLFTGFPWLPLSVSQWQRPLLLQITSVTGGYGLSFVLVAFNAGLAFYLHSLWYSRREKWWRRFSFEFYLALFLLFGAIGFGLYSSGAGHRERIAGPKVAFTQPNVGAFEKWDQALIQDNLRDLEDLTTYASYLGAELVLWPEAPTPAPVKGDPRMQNWVEQLARKTGLPMLIGNIAVEDDPASFAPRAYNSIFKVDPVTGVDIESYYSKRHLVPFGEYVPFAGYLPFLRKIIPVPLDFYPGNSDLPIEFGSSKTTFGEAGLLVCYEDIFPQYARKNTLAGADWHFVATNNGWFGEGSAGWQHAAHSVLRAVETRRPVVRCGNAGWSGWIDEFGHIRHVMLDDKQSIYFQGVEVVGLTMNRWWSGRLSPYVQLGDWFVGLASFVFGLGLLFIRIAGPRHAPVTVYNRRGLMSGLRLNDK